MDDESRAVRSLFIRELATNIREHNMAMGELNDELHDQRLVVHTVLAQLEGVKESVDKLNATVRDGNGKPSLIVRMTVVEEAVKQFTKDQETMMERQHIDKQTNVQVKWAVIVCVISSIAGLLGGAWALFESR